MSLPRELHVLLFAFMLLVYDFEGVSGSNITMFEFAQADSDTTCTNGLMADVDTAVFKCQVDYTDDKHMKHVIFQVKKKHEADFTYFAHVNVKEGCTQFNRIQCRRLDTYVLEIVLKLKASTDLSGAAVRGQLITSKDQKIETTEQFVPQIYELSADDSNVPIRRYDYLTFSRVYAKPGDIQLTIRSAACSLKGQVHQITCVITTNINAGNLLFIGSGSSIVNTIIGFLILLISIKIYRKITKKFRRIFKAFVFQSGGNAYNFKDKLPINPSKELMNWTCEQNPGHHRFFAINDFKLDYVHKEYQDEDVITLIKCIAYLTTRVCVQYTSEQRPNFKQDGIGMNQNYAVTVMTTPRFKTGMVINVTKYCGEDSTCPCEMCKGKFEQSTSWGKVFVLTASTVVYDDSEAEKSSFDLFYDSDTSDISTLHGKCVSEIDRSEDWCVVECVTCDLSLLDRLTERKNKCQEQMIKVNNKYNNPMHQRTFTCIVSHPHGCSKHVTVGHWKDKETVTKDQEYLHTRYEYTTRTCPGSAGAFVYILGVSDISQKSYHVHVNYQAEHCNYCSIGLEKVPTNVVSYL